jgi:hypothetical protein
MEVNPRQPGGKMAARRHNGLHLPSADGFRVSYGSEKVRTLLLGIGLSYSYHIRDLPQDDSFSHNGRKSLPRHCNPELSVRASLCQLSDNRV